MTLQPLEQILRDTDSWSPIDLNTLPDTPPVQPNLAGTGLVYPGKRHVFSGPPESAKTLAAYAILIQTARHSQIGVLVDFEMGAYDARQRLRELGATDDEIGRILYLEPDEPSNEQRIAALVAYQPAVVVIDAAAGAYQLEGLDDNKRGDVEKISQLYVGQFWRAGIATILIDHVVKNTETRGRFVIGSERKLGGADVHLGFDTIKPISRGTSGHYKITTHKDRGGYLKRGHLADLHLDSDPDTHQIEWRVTDPEQTTTEDGSFRPTHLMEKASRYLETRTPDETVTRNDLYTAALGGKGSARTAAVDALVREGFVTETPGPNRSKLLTATRPYREDDPICNPENATTQPTSRAWFSSGASGAGGGAKDPGGAVVQEWCAGGASTTRESGGAVVRVPTAPQPPAPLTDDHDYTPGGANGWFDADGNLYDPNEPQQATPTDDIDWGAA